MTEDELRQAHGDVWRFRAEMNGVFPTPGRDDSLVFAFTEVAEALDALMRENPVYKRNNDKEHTIERELAQCAMMLLTAVPSGFRDWDSLDTYKFVAVWTPRQIAIRVAMCLEVPSDIPYILRTIMAIGTAINLPEKLSQELDRMRDKYKPKPEPKRKMNDSEWWSDDNPVRYPQQQEGLTIADYSEGGGVE